MNAVRSRRWLFVSCYAMSGAAALVYQVVWIRLFTLELGHTSAASSTVLAAFMGGLAVGAWLVGRFQGSAHPLRIYAALEILIAALAVILPLALHQLRPALAWAYADGTDPSRFAVVRVIVSLGLLGLPAAAMGATFPVAATWFANLRSAVAQSPPATAVGMLYAANTAGATAGAIAAGFWLIPAVGLRWTTWTAVALNVGAAAGAIWLQSQRAPEQPAAVPAKTARRSNAKARGPATVPAATALPLAAVACAAAALSGFSALVYEVVWTRLLALVVGPTSYAFATMAAAFVSGIALGSAAGARLARRVSEPAMWLGVMLAVTAISAWLAAWIAATRLPLVAALELARDAGLDGSPLPRQVLRVTLLLLPTSVALGTTFVLALATASSGIGQVGRDAARVYVANTLGAVAGALAAGFLLIPWFGLHGSIAGVGGVGIVAGVALIVVVAARSTGASAMARGAAYALAGICIASGFVLRALAWEPDLLSSGAYKYARYMGGEELEARLRAGTLEYYKEGAAGTVSVRRLTGTRSLAIDGKVDASNGADMLTQRLLGVLPVLLHPRPQDMLVIGLGTGVTVGSALASGELRRVDVVEISPEVVEASELFAAENGRVLQAPEVRVVRGDGRSHLLLTTRGYDVIVSEPSNPWMAGVAALFTREFFQAARARLNDGGLFCQWAHTYEMRDADLRSIVRTFASVFPEGSMWLVGDSDLLLIGTNGATIESRLAALAERSKAGSIPSVLADVGITSPAAPIVLLSLFAGGPAEIVSFGADAVVQTDDRMPLEYTATQAMFSGLANTAATVRALTARAPVPAAVSSALSAADAHAWIVRGRTALKANAYEMAYESFQRASALDSRDAEALRGVSDAAAGLGRVRDVERWLQSLAAREPANAPARLELARVLAAAGDGSGAMAAAAEARALEPNRPEPLEQLASVFADAGDASRLAAAAEELVARFPDRPESHYYRATALLLNGRTSEAMAEARRVLMMAPGHARAHNVLGMACSTAGDFDCARTAFEASAAHSRREPAAYVNLGTLHLERGDSAVAAAYFAEALTLDRASVAAREGLSRAQAARPVSNKR
jgi:spermidine synthase